MASGQDGDEQGQTIAEMRAIDMRTVEATEAESQFRALLMEVTDGGTVEITDHGVPVARLIPVQHDIADALSALQEWRKIRQANNIILGEGITVRDLIEEGRRW